MLQEIREDRARFLDQDEEDPDGVFGPINPEPPKLPLRVTVQMALLANEEKEAAEKYLKGNINNPNSVSR